MQDAFAHGDRSALPAFPIDGALACVNGPTQSWTLSQSDDVVILVPLTLSELLAGCEVSLTAEGQTRTFPVRPFAGDKIDTDIETSQPNFGFSFNGGIF